MLHAISPVQKESLLYILEQAAGCINLNMNANKIKYNCFKQKGAISTQIGKLLKLVGQFTYLGSKISSTENDVYLRPAKAWNTIHGLSIIWKSDSSDKIKQVSFPAVHVSILLYGCTTWTQTKGLKKNPDEQYKRILWDVFKNIPEARFHKAATVWPPASYLTNHSSKANMLCIVGEARMNW